MSAPDPDLVDLSAAIVLDVRNPTWEIGYRAWWLMQLANHDGGVPEDLAGYLDMLKRKRTQDWGDLQRMSEWRPYEFKRSQACHAMRQLQLADAARWERNTWLATPLTEPVLDRCMLILSIKKATHT